MIYRPHEYQDAATKWIIGHLSCGLLLDMGLGKTVSTLTAVDELLGGLSVLHPLIIAPKLVAESTWTDERDKWDHLKHLRISRIIGTAAERRAAVYADADIWIVSRDNIAWLVTFLGKRWFYDMLIIDELSSFKNASSERFKAVKRVLGRVVRFTGLTGTPTPNGLLDLWSQVYLMDQGKRLGQTMKQYKYRYFEPERTTQYGVEKWVPKPGGSELSIYKAVSDICISMTAADYLTLEPRIDQFLTFDLPEHTVYKKFEKEKYLELIGADPITPMNSGALYNKLLQFANGAVYDDERTYHVVSEAKLDLLEQKIEELNGKPVIVFYSFQSDVVRLKERLPGLVKLKSEKEKHAWNRGEIEILLAHPASAGHGLNLQDGGHHIIWYGLPWSLELYQQSVKRLDRQGQKESVINLHILAKGTLEELVAARLKEKDLDQQKLLDALAYDLYLKFSA